MRVMFFGTAEFALQSLEQLAASRQHTIAMCVTQPDRPQGRGRIPEPSPVKRAAVRLGLPIAQPERLRVDLFNALAPDIGVVVAYGRLIHGELLKLPTHGMLGVHPSVLPKYRGAAPVAWALLNGETTTGVTVFRLSEQLDAGDIVAQQATAIAPEDDAATLTGRLAQLGAHELLRVLEAMSAGRASFTPQEASQASFAPKLTKAQGHIDWRQGASAIEQLVRATVPWPGAVTEWRGGALRVWRVSVADSAASHESAPGTVVGVSGDAVRVATGQGTLDLKEVQPAGRRRMSVREFLAGHPVREGDRFGTGDKGQGT